jgi:hypothetical protein
LIELEGALYVVELEAGLSRCFRADNQTPADYPRQDAELMRRHAVSLLDLAQADEDLAARVARELAGGYDIARARDSLGFAPKTFTRGHGRVVEYESARKAYESARRLQEALATEESNLGRLRDDLDRAKAAVERRVRLELALRRARAAQEVGMVRAELAAYPEGMERVWNTALDDLKKLRADHESACREVNEEMARRADAERRKQACGFPTASAPREVEDTEQTLGAALGRINDLRVARDRLALELAGQQTRRSEAAKQLRPQVDSHAAAALAAAAVSSLFKFAGDTASVRMKARALGEIQSWLGAIEGESAPMEADDPDVLREAVVHLERWLAAGDAVARVPGRRAEWATVAGTVVLVVVGLVLAVLAHPLWALAAVAGCGLLFARFAWRIGAVIDPRAEPRHEIQALGMDSPHAWTVPDVREALARLRRRHVAAALKHEKRLRWDGLARRISEQKQREREVDRVRSHWLKRLGLDLAASEDSEALLAVLAANLKAFQEAERERAAHASKLTGVEAQLEKALEGFDRVSTAWGLQPATGPDEARARFNAFTLRRRDFTEAHKILDDGRIDGLGLTVARAESAIANLFSRAGLGPDQDGELRDRVARRRQYDAARERLLIAESALESIDREVRASGEPELTDRPLAELQQLAEEAEATAMQAEGLRKRIAEIEAQLDHAKRGHDIEAKLATLDMARDALRDLRDQDRDRNLGALLADELARRRDDVDLPAALRRGRELFTLITAGRYALDVRSDPAGFLARDVTTDTLLTLDQLSGGTRLQLLLAARVAYLESQERGIFVPLVLDEALGNSNERRAEAVIEATLALSGSGRQVFYLTAQHDEVAKWLTILERRGEVAHKFIDLAEVRRLSPSERAPGLPLTLPPRFDVPVPEPSAGGDLAAWLDYGRKLEVPPFNPHDHPGQYNLWYTLAEPCLLYYYLRDGIDRWGQLRNLVESGLTDRLSNEHPTYMAAVAAVEALEHLSRLWKIGRGRPVDRQIILDSGAVSDKFVDVIADLARQVSGDASSLIQALRGKAVKGFQQAKIQLLQDYLINNDSLIDAERLDLREIRDRTRLQMQRHVEAGRISRDRLELLLEIVLHQLQNGG